MPANPRTIKLVLRTYPGCQILDGGPSRNKALDRETFEKLEETLGGTRVVRAFARSSGASMFNFMEADWVASTRGVHYINYFSDVQRLWEWNEITRVDALRKCARIHITAGGHQDLGMSRRAAESLARITEEYIRPVPPPDEQFEL